MTTPQKPPPNPHKLDDSEEGSDGRKKGVWIWLVSIALVLTIGAMLLTKAHMLPWSSESATPATADHKSESERLKKENEELVGKLSLAEGKLKNSEGQLKIKQAALDTANLTLTANAVEAERINGERLSMIKDMGKTGRERDDLKVERDTLKKQNELLIADLETVDGKRKALEAENEALKQIAASLQVTPLAPTEATASSVSLQPEPMPQVPPTPVPAIEVEQGPVKPSAVPVVSASPSGASHKKTRSGSWKQLKFHVGISTDSYSVSEYVSEERLRVVPVRGLVLETKPEGVLGRLASPDYTQIKEDVSQISVPSGVRSIRLCIDPTLAQKGSQLIVEVFVPDGKK